MIGQVLQFEVFSFPFIFLMVEFFILIKFSKSSQIIHFNFPRFQCIRVLVSFNHINHT